MKINRYNKIVKAYNIFVIRLFDSKSTLCYISLNTLRKLRPATFSICEEV